MTIKFLHAFSILLGFFTVVSLGKVIFFLMVPEKWDSIHPFLPEEVIWTAALIFMKDLLASYSTIIISAVFFTFGFSLRSADFVTRKRQRLSAQRILISISYFLIYFASLYASIILFFQPSIEKELQKIRYRTELVRAFEDHYFELKKSQVQPVSDLTHDIVQEKKRIILKRLINLRPFQRNFAQKEQINYEVELKSVTAQIQLRDFFLLRTLPGADKANIVIGRTIDELLLMAQQKLLEKDPDYFGANVLAYQVFCRLLNWPEQDSWPEKQAALAKAIVNQTWSAIHFKTLSVDERLKASYFFRKGKSLGDFQFQNYLEAYYGFEELHRENPTDEEVGKYLALAHDKVKDEVLFLQDMEVLFIAPGSSSLVFRYPFPGLEEKEQEQIIRIERLIDTGQEIFVKGFEFICLDGESQILLHWKAPYGKWSSRGLNFRVWDKYTPLSYFPVVFTQTKGHILMDPGKTEPPFMSLMITPQELEAIFSSQKFPSNIETGLLLMQSSELAKLGLSPVLLQTEFFLRLVRPCVFLLLIFLAFLASLTLYVNRLEKKAPFVRWILFFLLPLVVLFLLQGIEWSERLLAASLLLVMDFAASMAVVFILCLIGLLMILGFAFQRLKRITA